MLRSLRNLLVNIIAAFIRDSEARHKFRNRYKRKSKFRKLRDDNKQLISSMGKILNDIQTIKSQLAAQKEKYDSLTTDLVMLERERSHIFRVTPLDSLPPQKSDDEVLLAITCVAKNEGPYLREWIEYHKIVGVERFYFYDNESDDNTKEILEPYIKDGTVVYHLLHNHPIVKQVPQEEAYNDAIFRYRDSTKWMAIIDADEFIVPVEKNTITEFLADYEQYPGVVANWVNFDSNGYEKRATEHGGLITANYTRVRKERNNALDRDVKTIVNPKKVVYFTIHYGLYYHNFSAVTENFEKARGQNTKVHSSKKIRINHYRVKSREEYVNRIIKNSKNNSSLIYKLHEGMINFTQETDVDLVIQKYVPELKIALGIKD